MHVATVNASLVFKRGQRAVSATVHVSLQFSVSTDCVFRRGRFVLFFTFYRYKCHSCKRDNDAKPKGGRTGVTTLFNAWNADVLAHGCTRSQRDPLHVDE